MLPDSRMSAATNAVSPHDFKPLKWHDGVRKLGRCRHCYFPQMAHPVLGWRTARPLRDHGPATYEHDMKGD